MTLTAVAASTQQRGHAPPPLVPCLAGRCPGNTAGNQSILQARTLSPAPWPFQPNAGPQPYSWRSASASCQPVLETTKYSRGDPVAPAGRGESNCWLLNQQLDHPPSPSTTGTRPVRSMGEVKDKSRQRRAYAQQLVTTRLLDCLHDPVAQLSRLQRIYPYAL